MNKQELIDKAVEDLNGNWLDETGEENHLYRFYGGRLITGVYSTTPSTPEYVCNREEFENRAKELGWISGYKLGVEYPTNVERPDNSWHEKGELPPVDSEIEVFAAGEEVSQIHVVWSGDDIVFGWDMGSPFVYAHFSARTYKFRPIRTDRDMLVDVIASAGNLSDGMLADAIIAAGWSRDNKEMRS